MRFLWLLLALLAPVAAQAQDKLVVMSFNVRYPSPNDGANVWEKRRDLFVETVAAAAPDVIGTQELFQLQGDYLVAKLPQYSWLGSTAAAAMPTSIWASSIAAIGSSWSSRAISGCRTRPMLSPASAGATSSRAW